MQDLAASLQKVTLFADENILQTEAQLIAFGAARKDIPKLTETILNLASGMGRDLPGATMLMGKALAGEFSTLSRYGIIIDGRRRRVRNWPPPRPDSSPLRRPGPRGSADAHRLSHHD